MKIKKKYINVGTNTHYPYSYNMKGNIWDITNVSKDDIKRFIKKAGQTYDHVSKTYKKVPSTTPPWHNPYLAMNLTFTEKELDKMSEKELKNLYKLADNICKSVYGIGYGEE